MADTMLETAIRAGCTEMDVHLRCSWPDCRCKTFPIGFKAALIAALRNPDDRALHAMADVWIVLDTRRQNLRAALSALADHLEAADGR